MKKLTILFSMMLMMMASVGVAQVKADQDEWQRKIDKSDKDVANPKKNIKSDVWLDRGAMFVSLDAAPTQGLYSGMDTRSLNTMYGNSALVDETIGQKTYKKKGTAQFRAYLDGGRVVSWVSTWAFSKEALAKAEEAYLKAYEIDNGSKEKVAAGLTSIANAYRQAAANYFEIQDNKNAAKNFFAAYETSLKEPLAVIDTASAFNGGYLAVTESNFRNGAKYLNVAYDNGYYSDGDLFYLLYFCHVGLKDVEKAKEVLHDGLAKFPKNNKIVEGLMAVYTMDGGDATSLVPVIEAAIANDPTNPDLYDGLGRIYDKMGEADKSIDAFVKAAELTPEDYTANFNLGLLLIKKADSVNDEMRSKTFTSQAEYKEALETVNNLYLKSITPLEKAYELKNDDAVSIELLKNVCFRLREEEGIMDKYNKYNELFKNLQQ